MGTLRFFLLNDRPYDLKHEAFQTENALVGQGHVVPVCVMQGMALCTNPVCVEAGPQAVFTDRMPYKEKANNPAQIGAEPNRALDVLTRACHDHAAAEQAGQIAAGRRNRLFQWWRGDALGMSAREARCRSDGFCQLFESWPFWWRHETQQRWCSVQEAGRCLAWRKYNDSNCGQKTGACRVRPSGGYTGHSGCSCGLSVPCCRAVSFFQIRLAALLRCCPAGSSDRADLVARISGFAQQRKNG